MSISNKQKTTFIHEIGRLTIFVVEAFGDITLFTLEMFRWLFTRIPRSSIIFSTMYHVGVLSLPVVIITGGFIGMVLAVQTYDQFSMMHMETRLGAVINVSLVKELGPVLAATMLAGRIGSSMAAELGTMRVTEQIDALKALGANPIQHLVVPRFLACLFMVPLLTAIADLTGVLGGWFIGSFIMGIDSFHYWFHSEYYVTAYDVLGGLLKSIFFGSAIALIACHRGFNCGAGAEGVGKAATESFVLSFIAILTIDFFLTFIINTGYYIIWPSPVSLM